MIMCRERPSLPPGSSVIPAGVAFYFHESGKRNLDFLEIIEILFLLPGQNIPFLVLQ
jgi:hypothetical protein